MRGITGGGGASQEGEGHHRRGMGVTGGEWASQEGEGHHRRGRGITGGGGGEASQEGERHHKRGRGITGGDGLLCMSFPVDQSQTQPKLKGPGHITPKSLLRQERCFPPGSLILL